MKRSVGTRLVAGVAVVAVAGLTTGLTTSAQAHWRHRHTFPGGYRHLVVIYQENHSFDNLYGSWGSVNDEHVEGLADATADEVTQVDQQGAAYSCLPQVDANLATPPLSDTCQDAAHGIPASHFANDIFTIDDYIKPTDTTCRPVGGSKDPQPGGCTHDLVHRFYQEQYQINGGRQNRYVTGSDAVGLTQGVYDTKSLPIYRYLHSYGAPNYVIADHFFQAAFGGSFLNHQFLIAARAPIDTSAGKTGAKNSELDAAGMVHAYPLYVPTKEVVDGPLTQKCDQGASERNDRTQACGYFAVNTVQPAVPPHSSGTAIPLIDDADYPNIGDRLSAAGISWNWYAGGWDDAEAGHAGPLFQEHHQPFNYFAAYAPGQPGRVHLQDEKRFISAAESGTLPTVSFVKPYGAENEHPGYASEPNGSDHLVELLKAVTEGEDADSTLVVVTYDEFGGQWDHVAPPGFGSTVGLHDAWGPGTRVPALVLSRSLLRSGVDHTVYDTTSILATIERSLFLAPLSSRDAAVNDLSQAVAIGGRRR